MKSAKDIKTWIKEQKKLSSLDLKNVVARGIKTKGDIKLGYTSVDRLKLLSELSSFMKEG